MTVEVDLYQGLRFQQAVQKLDSLVDMTLWSISFSG
jgi:hypothetical protein